MNILQLREKIHSVVEHADERFLKIIEAIAKEYAQEPKAYDADGNPLSIEQLIKRAREASRRVKAGHFIEQEQIEKEVQNW